MILMVLVVLAGCTKVDTALLDAISKSEVGNVQRLLEGGADPMALAEGHAELPLEAAAKLGNAEIIKALLLHGAVADSAQGPHKPLWLALQGQHDDAAAVLVKGNARFQDLPMDSTMAFEFAAFNGLDRCLNEMLRLGADPNLRQGDGFLIHRAALDSNTELLVALIGHGAEKEALDSTGNTPLLVAAAAGEIAAVEILLQAKANPDAQNHSGECALHYAVIRGQADVVGLLLANKAEISLGNKVGETALHLAVIHGHLDLARLLLEQGAQVNARTKYGATPARISFELDNEPMTELLAQQGGRLR